MDLREKSDVALGQILGQLNGVFVDLTRISPYLHVPVLDLVGSEEEGDGSGKLRNDAKLLGLIIEDLDFTSTASI